MYRDGGVEPVEGASGRRVVSGCSSSGDTDTPSVVTTVGPMHAAESAGCSSLPAADVDLWTPPRTLPGTTASPPSACRRRSKPRLLIR